MRDSYYDNYVAKQLRELIHMKDVLDVPPKERYLINFYTNLMNSESGSDSFIPHSDMFYVKAALEAKFPDRKFTMQEVIQLVLEEYGTDYSGKKSKQV